MIKRPHVRIATINMLNNPSGFGKRANMLFKELNELQPDVICFQEIAALEEDLFLERLEQWGYTSSYSATKNKHHNGFTYGNLIVTRHEILEAEELMLRVMYSPKTPVTAAAARINKDGYVFNVISAHLAWGANMEWVRLRQAEQLAEYAERIWNRTQEPVVLGADLNTTPEASTIRFLRGLQEGTKANGTFWIDAWEMFGTPENAVTSDPAGRWGSITAQAHNLNPNLIPKRRIDYILSFGWNYGGVGSPLSFGRFGDVEDRDGFTISDHFGVYSDIALT